MAQDRLLLHPTGFARSDLDLGLIAAAIVAATLAGGVLALRIRRRLGLLAAFGAGAMIAVALSELLPEAFALAPPGRRASLGLVTLIGVLLYGALFKLAAGRAGAPSAVRVLGPASLVLHSLMDGFGIGVAFEVSTAAGLLLALVVLTHDLVDGANTVTLSVAGGARRSEAWRWLGLDALAPLLGLLLSRAVPPAPAILSPLLALFAGFFLYIALGELAPTAFKDAGRFKASVLMAIGALAVLGLAWLRGA